MRLLQSGLLNKEFEVNPNRPLYHYVDGVKEDRERWRYYWIVDFLQLYLTPESIAPAAVEPTTKPLGFLKLSGGRINV
jgi:hypothetical protein